MDLEDETRHQISGGKGEVLRPVGFVESDFVYGVGRSKEVSAGDSFCIES